MGKVDSRPRWRITLGGLLVVIALLAGLFNWLRPISQSEATRIAIGQFQQIPGAASWTSYRTDCSLMDGGAGKNYWVVNFRKPADNGPIAQVSMDPSGNPISILVTPPGHAAPFPAKFLTGPIPPPPKEAKPTPVVENTDAAPSL
ncbi:hypothetical protein V5E97_26010 [Singulisphaera sp. Ch08]|uniref:Uncharacterized protein n=1 Tax=Singulisphaera sp. Ch08 TaxID=3120278 RepID=A0AAU7CAP7_9BACT